MERKAMMMSPDGYYEWHLKGKSQEQIKSAIRGLKNQIGHLKNVMEHPDYGQAIIIHPSEDVRLWCTRLYLERAKEALVEAGGVYTPSQVELKAEDFEDNIQHISNIVFSIGGFHGGYETYTIDVTGEHLRIKTEHSLEIEPNNLFVEPDFPVSKDDFLDKIRELHIGEWRKSYTTRRFGYTVCDGTQWELEIYFSNMHKPVRIYGDNAYPYNFDELQKLFGIDNNECEE